MVIPRDPIGTLYTRQNVCLIAPCPTAPPAPSAILGHGAALLVGQVHHAPPVLLKGLARQDLREEVRGVVVGRDVLDGHDPSASQLAHLVELAIDVARMLRSAEPVAKIVCTSVVRADLDGALHLVAQRGQHAAHADQLDRALGECHELGAADEAVQGVQLVGRLAVPRGSRQGVRIALRLRRVALGHGEGHHGWGRHARWRGSRHHLTTAAPCIT